MPTIKCPISKGSGSYIIHKYLSDNIPNYSLITYHNSLNFISPALKMLNLKNAGLIHVPANYALFFSRSKTPLIITFHNYFLDSWMLQFSSSLQKIHYLYNLRPWIKRALTKASMVTAVSRFTADMVKNDLGYSGDIKVIYNGVDTNHFIPKAKNRKNKEIRVFFSGNLTMRKGAHWLPEIADKINKNVKIYYTAGLRTTKDLPRKENLIPLGPVKFEDMPNRYQEMDILLMPTVREGFGLSVAEAMACGLPVVATDCSAIPELLHHEKGGFLCQPGDTEDFVYRINVLSDSARLREDMGDYNRKRIKGGFFMDRMIKEYNSLFKEMDNLL